MFCVNDIIYLTGDTGVGKTSEVPKIILYGMNSLNMPYNRIISTQPIKAPVQDSPSRYSETSGSYYNIDNEDDDNNNYIYQFQHGEKKYISSKEKKII